MDIPSCTAKLTPRIADSLSSVSQTVLSAFSEMETKYQDSVSRLVEEVSRTRTERDSAIRRLHEAQLEAQERKHEVETLGALLKQSENTIAEQAGTIVQFKKDMNWWKDQARNWQEHFLRVEEARCTLTSRLEEYKERLNTQTTMNVAPAPLTPVSRYADSDEATATKEKRRLPDSCSSPEPAETFRHPTPRSATQRRKTPMPKTTKVFKSPDQAVADRVMIKQRKSNPVDPTMTTVTKTKTEQPPSVVHTRLIRRVHAVIPVKEESESEYEPLGESSPAAPEDFSPPPIQHRVIRDKGWKNARKRFSEVADDDNELFDGDVQDRPIIQEEEGVEEDDELMITSQTCLEDHQASTSASTSKRTVATPPTAKKRKWNNSHIKPSTKRRV